MKFERGIGKIGNNERPTRAIDSAKIDTESLRTEQRPLRAKTRILVRYFQKCPRRNKFSD